MSNSGNDQPLAPRRSLSKSQTSVDESTPPMGVPAYAREAPPRSGPPPLAPPAAGASGSTTYSGPMASQTSAAAPPRAAAAAPGVARGVRRARLRLIRIDPWSVTKTAFLLSIALGIMWVVAVFLLLSVMNAAGLWDHINQSIQGVLNQDPADAFDIKDYVSTQRVLGLTMLIGALDVVLITALATLAAFLYNMAASLLGGIEMTFADDAKR
jgi:Transmembrane domain of unknown function (DUF3566)